MQTHHQNNQYTVQATIELVSDLYENISYDLFKDSISNEQYVECIDHFDTYLDYLREMSPLSSFWMSYIDIVELMLQLVRASREKNWSLHLSAIRSMIPWCFAYDRLNYACYLPTYYSDMIHLPTEHPSVHNYLADGGFAVQKALPESIRGNSC